MRLSDSAAAGSSQRVCLLRGRIVVRNHDFNHAIVNEVSHRPWPMPDAPWVMTQTWHDLLFAHWPIDASALREHVPAAFELDLYDGSGWLAIVPFHMTN